MKTRNNFLLTSVSFCQVSYFSHFIRGVYVCDTRCATKSHMEVEINLWVTSDMTADADK